MNRSKPLFYSLALHASLIALFFGTVSTLRHISEPKKQKIAVSLLAYVPQSAPIVTEAKTPAPPKNVPLTPPETKPVIKTAPPKTQPAIPRTETAPLPPPPRIQPDTAANVPAAAPVPAKAAPAEPPTPKTPPPSIDHQRAYEEENLARIRSLLLQNKIYPKNAKRLKQQGVATVTFSVSPDGEVSTLITKSSGFEMLDDAARLLIKTTAPQFPKPEKTVQITIPIEYKLR